MTLPRLRKEIQDGGECGTEGKAQPEIIINLSVCCAFDCHVGRRFGDLSLRGLKCCRILFVKLKHSSNFIESSRACSSMFMLMLKRAGLCERTVSSSRSGQGGFHFSHSLVPCQASESKQRFASPGEFSWSNYAEAFEHTVTPTASRLSSGVDVTAASNVLARI